jgi:hypothetical protein
MTNDSTRMRIAVATVGTVAVVLLATACSGGGSHSPSVAHVAASASSGSPSPHSSASGDNVGYSRCMRSHGVPNFPDPDPNSGGAIPKTGAKDLGVDQGQFEAAQQACQSALPAATGFLDQERQCYQGGVCPPALVQQMLTVGRAFATCMRSHGVPNWPDPTVDDQGRPYFHISAVGITHDQSHSAEMTAKIDACFDASGGGLATG